MTESGLKLQLNLFDSKMKNTLKYFTILNKIRLRVTTSDFYQKQMYNNEETFYLFIINSQQLQLRQSNFADEIFPIY